MEHALSGYWDFYEDNEGYWRWRLASSHLQRAIGSSGRHISRDECVRDAMMHGYSVQWVCKDEPREVMRPAVKSHERSGERQYSLEKHAEEH